MRTRQVSRETDPCPASLLGYGGDVARERVTGNQGAEPALENGAVGRGELEIIAKEFYGAPGSVAVRYQQ